MRLVIQRCKSAQVQVGGETVASINHGLVVLWGIERNDTMTEAQYGIRKILNMKLWDDSLADEIRSRESGVRIIPAGNELCEQGAGEQKTWAQSVMDRNYDLLIVSQFTLFGSVHKGNKPDFHLAMGSETARTFFDHIVAEIRKKYPTGKVETGRFGAFMQVSLVNDGPVTLILEKTNSSSSGGLSQKSRNGSSPKCDGDVDKDNTSPKRHD